MRRYIRLKEFAPDESVLWSPPDWLLAECNDTVAQGKYRRRSDANGFIRNGEHLPDTGRPILFLGDSISENLLMHEDQRICSVLEDVLRRADLDVRVLNGAVSGATTLHLLNSLLSKGLALQPLAIILLNGPIDAAAAERPNTYWSLHKHYNPLAVPQGEFPGEFNTPGPRQAPDLGPRYRFLTLLSNAARLFGIPLWICTVPHYTTFDAWTTKRYKFEAKFDSEIDRIVNINRVARTFCTDNQVPLIDLEMACRSQDHLFYDIVHPNVAGAARIAELIGAAVADDLKSLVFPDRAPLDAMIARARDQENWVEVENLIRSHASATTDPDHRLSLAQALARQGRADEAVIVANAVATDHASALDISRLSSLMTSIYEKLLGATEDASEVARYLSGARHTFACGTATSIKRTTEFAHKLAADKKRQMPVGSTLTGRLIWKTIDYLIVDVTPGEGAEARPDIWYLLRAHWTIGDAPAVEPISDMAVRTEEQITGP